jgi:hypothetical protein
MEQKLLILQLTVKPNWQIYDISREGVDFVGYVFQPQRTRLRRSIADKFRVTCKTLRQIPLLRITEMHCSKLMAYKGWAKPANAKCLWRTHTRALVGMFPKQLRSEI